MHKTAMDNARRFFETYTMSRTIRIADIGAQDVNGSLRLVAPESAEYIGVDFVEGNGVDLILDDPYTLPFEDNSLDVVVSSSCFEHSEFFRLLFLEIMRVIKPEGLFYLNVPSNGVFHRYPVDCWRFYPDSGVALANWAKRNGLKTTVLESYTSEQESDTWNDFVCVFLKDEAFASSYPDRITSKFTKQTNALRHPDLDQFLNRTELPEDLENRYFKRLKNRFFQR
jgi:SAM-dependent methyltransferase